MFFSGISWLMVIIAAVVAFIGGWIWYSSFLFGKVYAKEMGLEHNHTGKPKFGMAKQFSLVFLGYIVMATTCASLLNTLFVVTFSQLLLLAVTLWAAFVLVTKMNDVIFGNKSWKLYAITTGQDLLSILLILTVLTFFGR